MHNNLKHLVTKYNKRRFLLAVAFFLAIFIIGILILMLVGSARKSAQTLHVVLGINGFSPSQITIHKGDTVTFSTTGTAAFWPASNLHPTHLIYPVFDPKKPIPADTTWSFVFSKAGKWQFHDHLEPYFTGTITVLTVDGHVPETPALSLSYCNGIINLSQKQQCWDDLITQTLQNEGLDKAFNLLDQLFQEPHADCHQLAHRVGEKAYTLFASHKNFPLSPKSFYCGYGFYHGFMEKLLHTTNNMQQARAFCAYAGKTLLQSTSDASGACYHGIGHGAVSDVSNPALWGDPLKVIAPALALCEKVTVDKLFRFRCYSGAFNALQILLSANQYKLSVDKKDPFSICKTVKEIYKRSCYTQMEVAAMQMANTNIYATAHFIETIPGDVYALETMEGLEVEFMRLKIPQTEMVSFCRTVSQRFAPSCISGVAEGFLKYGEPEKEYNAALNFCRTASLTESDKKQCFQKIVSLLRIWYSPEKSKQICLSVPEEYQINQCQYYL